MRKGKIEKKVTTGIEFIINEKKNLIKNKRVGIISNQTSVNTNDIHITKLISKYTKSIVVFAPEHGFDGDVDDRKKINNEINNELTIYSIFGEFKSPDQKILKNLDIIIYDIQDVGVKFYTFISNLVITMEIAKNNNIKVIVLDRPNPIRADIIEGPVTSPAFSSFIGIAPLPIRYGMTVGELALMINNEKYLGFKLECELEVIKMKNYKRNMWFDQTGLSWIPPSPNIPNLDTAILYPGTCLFEGTSFSEGRGTKSPFLIIGSPNIDASKLLEKVPNKYLEGVYAKVIEFKPRAIIGKESNPKFINKKCHGIEFKVLDRDKIKPINLAISLLDVSNKLFPNKLNPNRLLDNLWGNENLRSSLKYCSNVDSIINIMPNQIKEFLKVRENYLIY